MKLIKLTNDHYIIVDDSEIKEGDWYVHNQRGVGLRVQRCVGTNLPMDSKKITHSTEPLDIKITDEGIHLPDWSKVKPLSPRKVKELIGEVNVSKKAAEYANSRRIRFGDDFNDGVCNGLEEGYSLGYNQALEDNKEKKYTEEDLYHIFNLLTYDDLAEDEKIESCIEYIKDLLQSKTEWDVEIINEKLTLKQ